MTLFGKIIAGLFITAGVSIVLYFVQPSDTLLQEESVVVTEETSSTTSAVHGKKMAFSQFMKQDLGSYKCEVNQYLGDAQTKGTVYLDNGKVRGEFTLPVADQSSSVTTIVRDGYVYTWSSLTPSVGSKVKLTQADAITQNKAVTKETYQDNFDSIGGYSCTLEAIEESKFMIPTSITFTEVTK